MLSSLFSLKTLYNTLLTGDSIYQNYSFTKKEIEDARRRHKENLRLNYDQHKSSINEMRRSYLLDIFTSLERHFVELNSDLIASTKESDRDMFDQRNKSFQNIILASSMMFGALFTCIVDGNLKFVNFQASNIWIAAYTISCALSFGFLFFSITICIELLFRFSGFMYYREAFYVNQLKEAIDKTKAMISHMRKPESSLNKPSIAQIPTTNAQDIKLLWEKHEQEIQFLLRSRDEINKKLSIHSDNAFYTYNLSFRSFYRIYCKFWAQLAIYSFYGGTINLLINIMIYMTAEYYYFYKNLVAVFVVIVLLLTSLILGLMIFLIMRRKNREILEELGNEYSKSENIHEELERKRHLDGYLHEE